MNPKIPKIASFPRPGATEAGAATASIETILEELKAGRMVLILDDEDRENEGDLIMAAEHAGPEQVAFMIRHTSGIICTPMEEERLLQLELPQMVPANSESHRTAFTVSVDYRHGTSTGVSSADRSATIRALADPAAKAADFARPGHIFPLRSRRGGVLVRAGHTEAATDLCRLAGLTAVGVIGELMNEDGSMARRPECELFARRHRIAIGTIADLIRHRLRNERSIDRIADQVVQTEFGEFRLCAYEDRAGHAVHLALSRGRLDGPQPPLVRVHVADTLRDVLGIGTDRSWTLRRALARIAGADGGVVVVLREPDAPGELAEVLRALARPAPGKAAAAGCAAGAAAPAGGTAQGAAHAGVACEPKPVLRTFGVGAQILKDLGVRRMRVLSAPKQMHGLSAFDLEVESYVGADG
ncbi:MAG TPA: 3,4-dihydroxy-2-butanone-4-phosphate synthase [Steroidobacteraceae bacterium]|nr:3,4-dihydroxy-2-butanone-4-phosphate synthase [Steroidobacteraceae bacterium]